MATDSPLAPQRFAAGYIALSYVVSFLGSLSTLELLQRRTSRRGLYNWYLLVGSAVTMGGVAIWSMHYVGNRSIVLYPDSLETERLQLVYSPAFTALSFFVPIIVLLLAYLLMGAGEKVSSVRVGIGGVFAGLSISGMHYLGQAGIENYRAYYNPGCVVGAALIAVVATTSALTVFFILRKNFTNSWYKRVGCAVILSGGVSGMHWTATVGTRYRLRKDSELNRDTRNATVIITIVLSVVVCILLLVSAIATSRSRSLEHVRAQKVVLASATFDADGRLMVFPDGTLPIKEITDCFQEKTFEEGFGKSHAVFQWIYQTTRNWKSLNGLVEGMRLHLRQNHVKGHSSDYIEDYSFVFRELFCVAAQDLADATHRSLMDVGVLYDDIITTGVMAAKKGRGKSADYTDVEAGHGKGKLLFLIKKVGKSEATRLAGCGYRFTDPSNVVEIISRSTQVPKEALVPHLTLMASYNSPERMLPPGVHVGCFAVRPNVKGSFDVLVRADRRESLPTVQLPIGALEPAHLRFLEEHEGKSVGYVTHALRSSGSLRSSTNLSDPSFISLFDDALTKLTEEIQDPFFADAVLMRYPISVPTQTTGDNETGTALIITFKTIIPIHSRSVNGNQTLGFSPLRFFSLQQRCLPYSPDHDVHTRNTHREFSGKLAAQRTARHSVPKPKFKSNLSPWPSNNKSSVTADSSRPSTSSEKLVQEQGTCLNPFATAGIMVSQSISVEHAEAKSTMEMQAMGPTSNITVKDDDEETPTWVDVLFKGFVSSVR